MPILFSHIDFSHIAMLFIFFRRYATLFTPAITAGRHFTLFSVSFRYATPYAFATRDVSFDAAIRTLLMPLFAFASIFLPYFHAFVTPLLLPAIAIAAAALCAIIADVATLDFHFHAVYFR